MYLTSHLLASITYSYSLVSQVSLEYVFNLALECYVMVHCISISMGGLCIIVSNIYIYVCYVCLYLYHA